MKTYAGGCHCGAVQFEVEADLEHVMSCNCSHCAKKGFLLTFVPAEKFKLKAGEKELRDYRFNSKQIQHLFCTTCGVQSFGRGKGPDGSETIAVNVRCLDDVETDKLTPSLFDGKNR